MWIKKGLAAFSAVGMSLALYGCPAELGDPQPYTATLDEPVVTDITNTLDTCPEEYPCPPYGFRLNDTLRNHAYIPANSYGEDLANEDSVISMQDYYDSDSKLLFVMVTAGW